MSTREGIGSDGAGQNGGEEIGLLPALVEAEHELVKIADQMRVVDGALVGPQEPTLGAYKIILVRLN